MVKPQVVSEIPISMSELRDKLSEIRKRDTELNFRATKTEDYLNQIGCILESSQNKELKAKIVELEIPRLKPEHIVKIADILPITEDHLKLVLQGYILTISQANMKKIVGIVKDYIPQKK